MYKKLLVAVGFLIALTPSVTAGGTPPTLTWETPVNADPIACIGSHTSVHSLTSDRNGNIYVYCGYTDVTAHAIIKYNTNGFKVWQTQIQNPTPTSAIGISADSAGYLALAYCDAVGNNFKLLSQADGSTPYTFTTTGACGTGGSMPSHLVDTLTLNATSIQYLIGTSSLAYSFVCHWNLEASPCSQQFNVASPDFGPFTLTSGGPYIQAFVAFDPSITGGETQHWRPNLITGASQTAKTESACPGGTSSIPWYDTSGTFIYDLHTGCSVTPRYSKLTVSTFGEGVNDQEFTEPLPVLTGVTITTWAEQVGSGKYLDGENKGFWCGQASPASSEDYSSILKHDLGTNAQVWNITYQKRDPDAGGSEMVNNCILDKDGSLIVLGVSCTTGTASGCSFYLRKYASAGVPRTLQTQITPAGAEVAIGDNPIDDAVEFVAESWGMDIEAAGWLFGLAIFGMIVFRVRNGHPLLIAILAVVAIGLAFKLGLFPVWLLLVVVFLIIAVAGSAFFTKEEGTE